MGPQQKQNREWHAVAVDKRVVEPIKSISGEVRLPGSKSLSNRALLLAALADGVTVVENLLVRPYRHSSPPCGSLQL